MITCHLYTRGKYYFFILLSSSLFVGCGDLTSRSMQDLSSSKTPSCDSSAENLLSRQSRRTKYGPETEPQHAKHLRKRRSFLQTNFTSHVTFPLVPPHSHEKTEGTCYDGDSLLSDRSCSPDAVSLQEPKCDSNLFEAQPLVQLSGNTTASSSDTMDMKPGSLNMKSATDSCVHPFSAIHLQEGRECSDSLSPFSKEKQDSSLTSLHIPGQQSQCLSMSEIPLHLEDLNTTCKERTEDLTDIAGELQEHCVAGTEHHAVNESLGTGKALPETGVSYVLIEEIIHTTTKPSRTLNSHQGKKVFDVQSPDQNFLSAEKVEKQEELVLGPCKMKSTSCESRQTFGGSLLHNCISRMPSKGSLSEDGKQLDFSNATELFSNNDVGSGAVTRLSWLAFSSMVDRAETWQQTYNKHQNSVNQSEPMVNQVSLQRDELTQEPHYLSVVTAPWNSCLSTELPSSQKLEKKDITGDALKVDYKYKLPSPLTVPREENLEQRKTDSSDRLDYFSLESLCKSTGTSKKSRVSDPSFLCSNNPAKDAVASNNLGSPALMNDKESVTPRPNMDRCSCQFTYTSCFRVLDNETELEHAKPTARSTSEEPLTSPPSTRNPVSLDFNATRLNQEYNCVNGNSKECKNSTWVPDSHIKALSSMKERMHATPFDFGHLLDNVVELQEILSQFWGNRTKHPRDKCSSHFSENKDILYVESQRLISSCQKVIKTHGPSTEAHSAVQETFQNLLQLVEVCFEFTNCGLCNKRHKYLTVNLKDVVCSYDQFVQAAKQACERDSPNLSVKLLVCQYTALTAALFCLVQQFRALSNV
ncbi:FERM and PDZ domain-containing protein 1-like [Sceloporus undulatus]|uniref:FERM and PDZ domain-containing protein 1-like n=1 Tax=Sceloporus undulatus TaxID=8520 RepID=UPI001C4CA065|nr:FERM and PDZ domain-containing protein 1-like [Sceloporus undulatus]